MQDIDTQMRESYEKWKDACIHKNLTTTPAYDVVGLLAVIGDKTTYFDETNTSLEKKPVKTLKLKEEYRVPKTLSYMKPLLVSSTEKHNLYIITDFGEECDDEVACILASKLTNYNVKFIFTNKKYQEQLANFVSYGGHADKVHKLSTIETLFDSDGPNILLQIGPIHDTDDNYYKKFENGLKQTTYDWYLVGTFGNTLNSQKDAEKISGLFHQNSEQSYIVDTDRGKGAFHFTYKGLSDLDLEETLKEHVIKIGWRNTVGRASPKIGKFIAHLVSKPQKNINFGGGANYNTIKNISNQMGTTSSNAEDEASAQKLAQNYLNELMKAGLTVGEDDVTNSLGLKSKNIIDGYVYILTTLKQLFNVPINFFESGSPENWKPEWNVPGHLFEENKLEPHTNRERLLSA